MVSLFWHSVQRIEAGGGTMSEPSATKVVCHVAKFIPAISSVDRNKG